MCPRPLTSWRARSRFPRWAADQSPGLRIVRQAPPPKRAAPGYPGSGHPRLHVGRRRPGRPGRGPGARRRRTRWAGRPADGDQRGRDLDLDHVGTSAQQAGPEVDDPVQPVHRGQASAVDGHPAGVTDLAELQTGAVGGGPVGRQVDRGAVAADPPRCPRVGMPDQGSRVSRVRETPTCSVRVAPVPGASRRRRAPAGRGDAAGRTDRRGDGTAAVQPSGVGTGRARPDGQALGGREKGVVGVGGDESGGNRAGRRRGRGGRGRGSSSPPAEGDPSAEAPAGRGVAWRAGRARRTRGRRGTARCCPSRSVQGDVVVDGGRRAAWRSRRACRCRSSSSPFRGRRGGRFQRRDGVLDVAVHAEVGERRRDGGLVGEVRTVGWASSRSTRSRGARRSRRAAANARGQARSTSCRRSRPAARPWPSRAASGPSSTREGGRAA